MPFDPISPPVESLTAESASVQAVAEYFAEELGDILVDEQCNAALITRIEQLILEANAIANAFS